MTPPDPEFEARVRGVFGAQPFMAHIGATLTRLAPGEAEITAPFANALTQHGGFFHGGLSASIADTAAGCAAATLFKAEEQPLTVEFKINFLAPAQGEALVARGRVLRAGRSLSVTAADVFARKGDEERPVATLLATMAARPTARRDKD